MSLYIVNFTYHGGQNYDLNIFLTLEEAEAFYEDYITDNPQLSPTSNNWIKLFSISITDVMWNVQNSQYAFH